jgi:hypothetical protein
MGDAEQVTYRDFALLLTGDFLPGRFPLENEAVRIAMSIVGLCVKGGRGLTSRVIKALAP